MGKINWNRVILGGLVAGMIINFFEFALHGAVLAKDMDAAVRALGREVGGGELLMFLAWGFTVASSPSGSMPPYAPATAPVRKPPSARARPSGALGICWRRSCRLHSIFSRDTLWLSALQWDWWKSLSEPWQAPGSTAKRPPDLRQEPRQPKSAPRKQIHYRPRPNP
jgi:hypothetical protein